MLKKYSQDGFTFGYKGFFITIKGKYAIAYTLLTVCGVGFCMFNALTSKTQ